MTYFKLMGLAIVVVLAIVIGSLVLIGTSGDGDDDDGGPTNRPTPTEEPTATFVGGPTQAPTAEPTTVANEVPLGVPDGGGGVPLAAGNYRTERFQPQAHFALEDGWSANVDSARLVQLFRGGEPPDNCVCLISPDGVISANGGSPASLPGNGTVDGMIDWLTGNANLITSNPSSLQVGNLSGRQLDVEVQTGVVPVDEVEYLSAGDQRFKVVSGEKQHLTVLDYRGATLIIAQRSPTDQYSDYFRFVEDVFGGLTFSN